MYYRMNNTGDFFGDGWESDWISIDDFTDLNEHVALTEYETIEQAEVSAVKDFTAVVEFVNGEIIIHRDFRIGEDYWIYMHVHSGVIHETQLFFCEDDALTWFGRSYDLPFEIVEEFLNDPEPLEVYQKEYPEILTKFSVEKDYIALEEIQVIPFLKK